MRETDHRAIARPAAIPPSPAARRLRNALLAVSLLGVAALVLHAYVRVGAPADGVLDHGLYLALELGGVLACVARAVLVRERRAAWICIAVAGVCWFAGDVVWALHHQEEEYPALADLLFLACYPIFAAGVALLLTGRRDRLAAGLWVDGAVVGLTIAALGAALLYDPLLDGAAHGPARTIVDLAYPTFDVMLVVLVVVAIATQAWRPGRGWALLGLGALALALADAIYLYLVATGDYREGAAISALWPVSLVLWGWAAWQPWSRPHPGRAFEQRLFVFPAGFALVSLAVLFYGQFEQIPLAASLLALAALLLATGRAAGNYRQSMRLTRAAQREARTDGLTGLPNRRKLMADLDEALAPAGRTTPRTLVFFDLDGFKHYNDAFGHVAGDMLLRRLSGALLDAVGDGGVAYRLGGDEFCVLLDGEVGAEDPRMRRCVEALNDRGDGFHVSTSHGAALLPAEATDPNAALTLADQRMYAMKDERRPAARRQTSDVLMQVLREREPELHDHSDGVTELVLAVGRRLGLAGERLDEAARAAELHDIGKLAVPEAILHKPGPLDDEEWQLMRQHTVIGDRILAASPAMRGVARIVRASHERWDGAGYPDGLAGEEIPLGARIVSVCDSYSAMTSARPYQRPLDHAEAVAELRRCAGTQFDPAVVAAFCAVHPADIEAKMGVKNDATT